MELQNVRRIAVFKMRNIGDVLMTTPVLRALRETFPDAKITAIVNSGTEAMLAHNPHIDEVLVYQRKLHHNALLGRLAYEFQFVRELRRRRFDLTIGFTEGDRTAWYTIFIRARYRLGTAHYTVGKYDPRRRIYNLPMPFSPPTLHEVEKHFYLLEQAGLKLKSTTPGNLCLVIPDDHRAWAKNELTPLRPAPVIHVHPVSRWLWKCWKDESMAAVIDWLQTERQARVIVTTGPIERERQRARDIVSLCRTKPLFYDGNLSLTQTAALTAASDAYFGVDTAPMHMAAAVGVPVIALFGPTHARNWGPWTPLVRVLSHGCPCYETRSRACDWSQVRACLASIAVEEAQAALDEVLAARKNPALP
ncbi:MAG: putative lipopolysaccharide heptosyltransferase III [Methylacidiphilales bacterium]|nr:putative lipopolysaccharide heptosyltransferase III [Candidatus Methylacidiphilales bacterium]